MAAKSGTTFGPMFGTKIGPKLGTKTGIFLGPGLVRRLCEIHSALQTNMRSSLHSTRSKMQLLLQRDSRIYRMMQPNRPPVRSAHSTHRSELLAYGSAWCQETRQFCCQAASVIVSRTDCTSIAIKELGFTVERAWLRIAMMTVTDADATCKLKYRRTPPVEKN
jgi:hypothetical protein